jgi:hypothetical protein
MNAKKWIAVLVLVALVALFMPIVPMTQSSGQFLGAHYQQSAQVSPSYYLFHCGSYLNPQTSYQLGSGYAGFYQVEKGYTFTCDYSSG